MTISYNWLKEYLPIDLSAERVGEILTDTGLEIEKIEKKDSVKGGLEGVVIGQVITCDKHPNADRLSVTTVDIGKEENIQIVCGAPNVGVGQKVPVATVGTVLYDGNDSFKIKKGRIRGETSMGMICAEDELGLGDNHDGIMVLDDDAQIGIPARDYFQLETDYIFEIGLTPNRTDAMGHFGVARDLRAGLIQQGVHVELQMPAVEFKVDNTNLTIPVEVENTDACPQYFGVTISNVQVAPSPDWLQNRLRAIGQKPINNVVDITNYVLHEFGHPLHAFDAGKITGDKVIVKNQPANTIFTTLDEVERKLDEHDLMICNSEKGMCIAGVFGGVDSGVNQDTKNVFLEGAWFNPVSIRKTAKRHGLSTDASYRYERGVDPNFTKQALMRAAMLIKEVANGEISSEIQEAISQEFPPKLVQIDLDRVDALIGNKIAESKLDEILLSLEIKVVSKTDRIWQVEVPTYRADVTREADVIEEILRIYGFNNVKMPEQMHFALAEHDSRVPARIKNEIMALLIGNGYYEIMNNSLTKASYYEKFAKSEVNRLVNILNPLSQDLGVMRQTLLFGAMEVVAYNLNRQTQTIKAFEFGKSYFKNAPQEYQEDEQLIIFLSGKENLESWTAKQTNASFFNAKGIAVSVIKKMGVSGYAEEVQETEYFGETLILTRGNKELLRVGQVKNDIAAHFNVDQPVYAAIFNWSVLVRAAVKHKSKFIDLPRFPWVRRDLALLVDNEIRYEDLRLTSQKAGGKLIKEINLFDVYTGKNLPAGKKSYAMSFILQDPEQTLVDKRVDSAMQKITVALSKKFGAELR